MAGELGKAKSPPHPVLSHLRSPHMFAHSLALSFTRIFLEHLLRARHCAESWG